MELTRRGFVKATVGAVAAAVMGAAVTERVFRAYPARQTWKSEPLYFRGQQLYFDDELDTRRGMVFSTPPHPMDYDWKNLDWQKVGRRAIATHYK